MVFCGRWLVLFGVCVEMVVEVEFDIFGVVVEEVRFFVDF